MSKSKFYDQISHAREEREVDAVYTKGLNTYFKGVEISHPFKCDSYLDTHTEKGENLRLLIEYKYDENFATQTGIAKVLTQVIFYLKQFELSGMPLPNVVLVGDTMSALCYKQTSCNNIWILPMWIGRTHHPMHGKSIRR